MKNIFYFLLLLALPACAGTTNVFQAPSVSSMTQTDIFTVGIARPGATTFDPAVITKSNLEAQLIRDGLKTNSVSTDASALTTGILDDARLSANIPRLNYFNVFTAGGLSGTGWSIPWDGNASFVSLIVANGFGIGNLNGANIASGTVNSNALDAATLAKLFSGGGGGGSTDASSLTSGTLNDARLSANVPLQNAANTFTAPQTLQTGTIVTNDSGTSVYLYFKAKTGVRGHIMANATQVRFGNDSHEITMDSSGNAYVEGFLSMFAPDTNVVTVPVGYDPSTGHLSTNLPSITSGQSLTNVTFYQSVVAYSTLTPAGTATVQLDKTNDQYTFGGTNQIILLPTNAIIGQNFFIACTNASGSGIVSNRWGNSFFIPGVGYQVFYLLGGANTPSNSIALPSLQGTTNF